MITGRQGALVLLLAAHPGLALGADACTGDDLSRLPPGATDGQVLYADVPAARFPGKWQQGRIGDLTYRIFPGGLAMIGPAPSMAAWRIEVSCDLEQRQCSYRDTGGASAPGKAAAQGLARCILGPEPPPAAVPPAPAAPSAPQPAAPSPTPAQNSSEAAPPAGKGDASTLPPSGSTPPAPTAATPQPSAPASPARSAAPRPEQLSPAAPQAATAPAQPPSPATGSAAGHVQAGSARAAPAATERQPAPVPAVRPAPEAPPAATPEPSHGFDAARVAEPFGNAKTPAITPPRERQETGSAQAASDDAPLEYSATQGTAILPPLSRAKPRDEEEPSPNRLLPQTRPAAAGNPVPPSQPRPEPVVPPPSEALPSRREARPASTPPAPAPPAPAPVARRPEPPRPLPPVRVVQAPPPPPPAPAVVQTAPQPWPLSPLALTRCTVSSAMALGREDITEIGEITLSVGCAGRIGDRLTFSAALTTFPVHDERHGGKTTYSYSVNWRITDRVALTYANYAAALTGGRGLAGLGDGRLQLSAALPEFPLGTSRFPNRALRCSAFANVSLSTAPVNGGVSCGVNVTERLTLRMTALAYPRGQQRRTDPDFSYAASYAFNDKVMLTYSNYGNNRWPWNRSSDSVELFHGGTIGLNYRYDF